MAENTGSTTEQSNWLSKDGIPAELKLMIFEHINHPDQMLCLAKAYPEWVSVLWNQYPKQLFPRALENLFRYVDPDLRAEVLYVYHIRRIRREYATAMKSSAETQLHRDGLQADLRSIISSENEDLPELDMKLQTILDIGAVVRDVHCLTYRYSNDAWRRIYDISVKTRKDGYESRDPPAPKLARIQQFDFNRAFLNVEIYLLTKFWTNNQGQRHILDMGDNIVWGFQNAAGGSVERQQFGSCLRYIFDAYRWYVKKMARDLNAPELPTRDDMQWVPTEFEVKDFLYRDDGTITPEGWPEIDFPRRSVSEEQRFLLWLCESGIRPLEWSHRADDRRRRDKFLLLFGRRDVWDTVDLRHRAMRYDAVLVGRPWEAQYQQPNRHPVTSLYYGAGTEPVDGACSPASACAPEFLGGAWSFDRVSEPRFWVGYPYFSLRDAIILNSQARWLMLSDTDMGGGGWVEMKRKDVPSNHTLPRGHQYMIDPENYDLGLHWLPRNIFMGPASELLYF